MTDAASSSVPAAPPPAGERPRLIATDLDGTLLRDDKTVSARTVAALAAAEAADLDVVFVTGRPARWMGVVAEHVHGHGMAICANGAAVVDLHRGGELTEIRPLLAEDALAVAEVLRRLAPGTSFAVERAAGFAREPEYPVLRVDADTVVAPVDKLLADAWTDGNGGSGHSGHSGRSGAGPVEQPLLKLLAYHPSFAPDEYLTLARSAVGDRAEFTRSSRTALLEISGRGVSKASTLARCCAAREIGPAEVVAFGDMPNDIEMLTWAGTSYAMANAHPEVLAATTHRTAANEEDGVAAVIEQLLHGL